MDFEQGIWEIAFAMLESMLDDPPPMGWNAMKADDEKVKAWFRKIDASDVVKDAENRVGPSSVMLGAARSAAAVIARNGYKAALNKAPACRIIGLTHNPAMALRPVPGLNW